MSNALAIAAVSAVLKDLLNNGLIDHDVSTAVGNPVTVSVLPPDRVKTGDEEQPQLNLFLYQVAPNPGWQNAAFPSRDEQGARLTNPPLALDLRYLLTAYGKNDFDGEILLGYAMQLLHENPVLPRAAIRSALGSGPPDPLPGPPVTSNILPIGPLSASDLADQVELIKISPQNLNTEELSKLWTALQAHYRPTAAYHISVVLIQSTRPARSTLPVLTRGKFDPVLKRDQGVIVQPDLLPPFPTLLESEPPKKQSAVRTDETLVLRGRHLDGDQVSARFTDPRTLGTLDLNAEAGATATQFQIKIPSDSPSAGVYSIAAIVKRAGEPDHVSNELPIAVAPTIKLPITVASAGGEVTIEVKCSPKVATTQRVTLVVGIQELPGELVLVNPTDTQTDTLAFKSGNLASGSHPVRLRVDGVESILVDRSVDPPVFIPSEQVNIP